MDEDRADLIGRIRAHARHRPDREAVVFRGARGREQVTERMSYAELDRAARAVGRWLAQRCCSGDRVLLLHPPGLEFAVCLIGCLYAGVVAVPAPVPDNNGRRGARAAGVVSDAGVALALTVSSALAGVRAFLTDIGLSGVAAHAVDALELAAGDWLTTPANPERIAVLQYTSGSTSDPKGVVVTHASLSHNLALIARSFGIDERTRACSWLPHYHDMGLIGMLLTPLYLCGTSVLMSPTDFLRRPHRWLRLIHDERGTFTSAPDFAFALCARQVRNEQLDGLDLSCLDLAVNGSEPPQAATMKAFGERFAEVGFRSTAFSPSYGMAEATLFVSGTPAGRAPVITEASPAELERGALVPRAGGRALVSSGPVSGLDVRIVDPRSAEVLPDGQIGEVWVRGKSVAAGYWSRPEETEWTFRAVTACGAAGFLRTGDLGALLGGELHITGRLKDVLIIHGRNLYPQDIERDVAELHQAFHGLQGSVCSVPADQEEIVVMQELRRRGPEPLDLGELAGVVRADLAARLGLRVANLVFLRPGQVLRTSSGKIRRAVMRELFIRGEFSALHEELSDGARRRYRTPQVPAR